MAHTAEIITRILLYPFGLIYGLIAGLRNRLYDVQILKSRKFNFPVIVVGNITAGGTGKTPHVEYLVRLLRREHSVTVLSRGYKRKSKGLIVAHKDMSWETTGDEPFQIKHKYPDIRVVVDKDREKALDYISQLDSDKNSVVILDDGFQHRRISPGLSILLVDFNRPLSSDTYLPAGRLRESRLESKRAGIIIFTKCPEQLKPADAAIMINALKPVPYQKVFFTRIDYQGVYKLFDENRDTVPVSEYLRKIDQALVVTGIANPEPLYRFLEMQQIGIEKIRFKDHYRYVQQDIKKIEGIYERLDSEHKCILTTGKDAVKLETLERKVYRMPDHWYVIEAGVKFLRKSEESDFNNTVINYVKEDRRNSKIPQG